MGFHSVVVRSLRTLVLVSLALIPIEGFGEAWESSAAARSFRKGDLQAVKRIVKSDEEFYKAPEIILEALPTAITSGNVELVKYLASLGWLEECRKVEYCKLIHIAAQYGRVGVIRFLVSRGFDAHAITGPTAAGEGGKNSALHKAARGGHFGAVMFLCEQGVDADLRNESGRTALGEAKYTSGTRSLGATPEEDARNRANVAKVIEYLESGQCKKK